MCVIHYQAKKLLRRIEKRDLYHLSWKVRIPKAYQGSLVADSQEDDKSKNEQDESKSETKSEEDMSKSEEDESKSKKDESKRN
jgi:hypothetical protein